MSPLDGRSVRELAVVFKSHHRKTDQRRRPWGLSARKMVQVDSGSGWACLHRLAGWRPLGGGLEQDPLKCRPRLWGRG